MIYKIGTEEIRAMCGKHKKSEKMTDIVRTRVEKDRNVVMRTWKFLVS